VCGLKGGEQHHLLVRCRRHGRVAVGAITKKGLDIIAHSVLLVGLLL
jgi:hypothetical protein